MFDEPHAADALDSAPASIVAEQALIGVLLLDNAAYGSVSYLRPDQFYEPLHARIWAYAIETIEAGRIFEPVSTIARFGKDPALAELGGMPYLADLIDHAPMAPAAPSYAEAVIEMWTRRELFGLVGETRRRIDQGEAHSAPALIAELRHDLERLEGQSSPDEASMQTCESAGDDVLEQLAEEMDNGKTRGAMTGLRCIDRRLGGLKPGWLVVLGARPSMGKTALARCIAHGAARRNPTMSFAFFAIEMEKRELIERALSALTFDQNSDGLPYQDIGNGKITPMDMLRLRDLRRDLPRNLVIDDRSVVGLDDIRRRTWALKRRGPVGAIFIDYLQLMALPQDRSNRNDTARWGEITRGLKMLAREAQTAVVLLSQLNRAVESRDDKRPQLSDLRDSGSIEQDANAVLFPYREAYYLARSEPKAGSKEYGQWELDMEEFRHRLDVIAAKVRQGATGTDRQTYRAEFDFIEDCRE